MKFVSDASLFHKNTFWYNEDRGRDDVFTRLFLPKSYARNIYAVDVERLAAEGYRLLLCDIDNTLVAFHETVPTESARKFFERCQKAGLNVILCSNNTRERVKTFSEASGVDYVSFFCKPFSKNYRRLLKKTGFSAQETVVAGDQILTDILGGNRMDLHTIFLDPLVEEDSRHTEFSRFLERYILRWLSFQGKWKKGEYYGYKM